MKSYFLFFIFLYINLPGVCKAKSKNFFYKEKYVYSVKYFNISVGEIHLNITKKSKKEIRFNMRLGTKKQLAWIYSLNQSLFAVISSQFLQLREWKNTKVVKKKSTYEHIRLLPPTRFFKKTQLVNFNKKKVAINKKLLSLKASKSVHSLWTAPWYIAAKPWKKKKTESIYLLYKKKIVAAKIKALSVKEVLVINKKIKVQKFSVYSDKEKAISLKVWVGRYKKNNIVSRFSFKLKRGHLQAKLKSYKKEQL